MGSGKTTAMIKYLNDNKNININGEKRFMVCVPYISEVDRIVNETDFKKLIDGIKLEDLKRRLKKGENVVITHSLFNMFDEDIIEILQNGSYKYSLFYDELPLLFKGIIGGQRLGNFSNELLDNINELDLKMLIDSGILIKDTDKYVWNDDNLYNQQNKMVYKSLKNLCMVSDLYSYGTNKFNESYPSTLITLMKPKLFYVFNEVWFLGYLFKESILDNYIQLYQIRNIEYYHIENHEFKKGYVFEYPKKLDYIRLHDGKYNFNYSLSKSWYNRNNDKLKDIGRYTSNYLRSATIRKSKITTKDYIWTTFAGYENAIIDGNKNLSKSRFVPCNTKATNEYKNVTAVAYLCNRFQNTLLVKFFASKGIIFNDDLFALSEIVQFIWRTNIREPGILKQIDVFIPNERMRNLFFNWITDGRNKEYILGQCA